MGDTATASAPITVNTAEKPIEEQKEELVGKITDLAKDPVNNSAELAQLAMKYADLEKLDIAQKAEVKKEEETIQAEQTQEHKEEMDQATQQANQEKAMKMEDLINKLQDKPENAEKNAEELVEQSKTRIKQTIDRYTNKIKELNTANETEKAKITKELEDIRTDLKKEKEKYENAKNYFMGKLDYKPETLSRVSTRRIRWFKKVTRDGETTYQLGTILKMKTIKRRMTINKLIKKFNKIGDKSTDGVKFIMGFEKTRFMRYTGINITSGISKLGENMGMQINPEKFHEKFNKGKANIFAVLDDGAKTPEEQKVIDAIKARINYYGYAYARQRASARTDPFLEAQNKAKEGQKIEAPQSKLDIPTEKKQELLTTNPN